MSQQFLEYSSQLWDIEIPAFTTEFHCWLNVRLDCAPSDSYKNKRHINTEQRKD